MIDPIMDERITKLKAEIFDILLEADRLNQVKNDKMKELDYLQKKKNQIDNFKPIPMPNKG